MKKLCCLLLCLLLLILAGCGKADTDGEIFLADGYRQSTYVYAEQTRIEDRSLVMTVINKTERELTYKYRPRVQRLSDGEWEDAVTYNIQSFHSPFSVTPNSETQMRCALPEDLDPGEYRLIFDNSVSLYGAPVPAEEDVLCLVVSFTVPDTTPNGLNESYLAGGIQQNPYVHLSVVQTAGERVEYSLFNVGEATLHISLSQVKLQVYRADNNAFADADLQPTQGFLQPDTTFSLDAGESITEVLNFVQQAGADPSALPAGLYRLKLPCRFEGGEASFTVFADFIMTASGASDP